MGAVNRGIRNAFRNSVRTFSITIILALSIAMSLIMLLAMKTVQTKIDSVKSSIGNTITVSPAGVRGFEGGGTLLTTQNIEDISTLPHVVSTISILNDRLSQPGSTQSGRNNNAAATTNNTTNLASPVTPGSFGNRQRANTIGTTPPTNFSLPVQIIGISDLRSTQSLAGLGVSQFNLIAGNQIDPTLSTNIALIGKDLATKNNLSVGNTFQAYNHNMTVSGVFDAGSTFANATVVVPIKTLQTLSAQTDQIDSAIVVADSIDSISTVKTEIAGKLGGNTVDIASQQDQSNNAIAPLQNIKTVSLYSLIGSMVAGATIIFLTMVMIVRERRREIGVLKAIGSSNIKIVMQFISESFVLTLLGSFFGMILGFIFSNPVLNVLVTNSVSSTTNTQGRGEFGLNGASFGGGGGGFARIGAGLNNARGALQNIHAVVGWDIILYGLAAAVIIAIIGSAIPAFLIAKVRPAEVMRTE